MKTSFLRSALLIAGLSAVLSFSAPLFGADDNLNKALDLVNQAWNPGGDAPSNAQRTDLLKQALKLAQGDLDHHIRGFRVKAIKDIQSALAELDKGDPDHKATDYIHDADSDLRQATSIAD